MKVLFFGTHPFSTNGYSYVVVELAKEMAKKSEFDYSIYGFQNFVAKDDHKKARQMPENVFVYDACANENPRQQGFGFDQVTEFVTNHKPDVVIIYNDMIVVSNVLDKLKAVPDRNFKIIVYADQVYLHQKKEHIARLNKEADFVLAFTPYWEDNIKKLGITKPTDYLCHGFSKEIHYPVPKALARQYYGLKESDFIIMNLNRNQPRKRWDTCLQAFAEIVSRHPDEPVKLLIATAVNGAWNLMEVYERELWKRGITLEEGMKHIILIDNPQQLSDEEINILYNVADVGINTCDGEGYGLCNFQQAAIGIPQIVPYIGGFREFFTKDNALLVEPKFTFYVDAARDGVGGEAQICDPADYVDAIEAYINDKSLVKLHGKRCREEIPVKYSWDKIADRFANILKRVVGDVKKNEPSKISLKDLENLEDNLNINDLKKKVDEIQKTVEAPVQTHEPPKQPELLAMSQEPPVFKEASDPTHISTIVQPTKVLQENSSKKSKKKQHGGQDSKNETKDRLRKKLEAKKTSKDELLMMKKKLDKLLSAIDDE